ncbi:hypothetical protein CGLAUT_11450 [Corynebacterium glaucum]|nr:hypothetical protein CGLAUT_11450 [Corynebacterium glaucum]
MRGGRETVTIRFGGFMDTDVGNQVGKEVGNVVLWVSRIRDFKCNLHLDCLLV